MRSEILRTWGFSADPFSDRAAENDERLERAFVAPRYFDDIVGNPQRPQPAFVFGWRGEGKSTLCRMVAHRLRHLDHPPLVVEATDFSGWPVEKLDSLTLGDHVWRILEASVSALVDALGSSSRPLPSVSAGDRVLLEDFVLRWLPAVDHSDREARLDTLLERLSPEERRIKRYGGRGYRRVASYLRGKRFEFEQAKLQGEELSWLLAALMLIAPSSPSASSFAGATPQRVFDLFIGLVLRLGFPSLFVLVDNVDEVDVVSNQPDLIAQLIRPLVTSVRFLESKGLGIKIFLPAEARDRLMGIRTDRIQPYKIEWTDARLEAFLRARVRAFSDERHERLEHIFEDYAALEPRLLRASARAPRNMLRVLDEIVREHCERDDPPPRIDRFCVDAGLRSFSERRALEDDGALYRARLEAWDAEHENSDDP
jgi:hypothetical protein